MIEYVGQINLPNQNIGQTGKTITANEQVRTCDVKALAKEVVHEVNNIVGQGVAELVINSFCRAMVGKMTEGFAIQMMNEQDVMMRIFPDVHLKCQSVNLAKARELLGVPTLTEDQMVERAGEIIDKVGVRCSVRAVVQQKFTELLEKEGYQLTRTGIQTATAAQQNQQASEEGSSSEQEQQPADAETPVLTVAKTGTGTFALTDQTGHQVESGAAVQAGQTLTLAVTPAGSATPTATIGSQAVTLTEDEGQWVGTFQMPAASATLTVRTGGTGDNEE